MSYRSPTDREIAGLDAEADRIRARIEPGTRFSTVFEQLHQGQPNAIILEHSMAVNRYLEHQAAKTEPLFTLAPTTKFRAKVFHLRTAYGTSHAKAASLALGALHWLLPFYRLLFDNDESWDEACTEWAVPNAVRVSRPAHLHWLTVRQLRLVQPACQPGCYSLMNTIYTEQDASRLATELLSWETHFSTKGSKGICVLGWPGLGGREHLKAIQLAQKASTHATEGQMRAFIEASPPMVADDRQVQRRWAVEWGEEIGANHSEIASFWVKHELVRARNFQVKRRITAEDRRETARSQVIKIANEYRSSYWHGNDDDAIPTALDLATL